MIAHVGVLTLEMVRGMLKSFPPCSLKPHGAGPFKVTAYVLIFSLSVDAPPAHDSPAVGSPPARCALALPFTPAILLTLLGGPPP